MRYYSNSSNNVDKDNQNNTLNKDEAVVLNNIDENTEPCFGEGCVKECQCTCFCPRGPKGATGATGPQ